MRCLNCEKEFMPLTVIQKYCSAKCGRQYRHKNKGKIEYPSITFCCAQCGKKVVTEEGSGDKRERFCSRACEKKFWKHPHWENTATRINFRTAEEYFGYERRTNEE